MEDTDRERDSTAAVLLRESADAVLRNCEGYLRWDQVTWDGAVPASC